jgi:hypothetical protein
MAGVFAKIARAQGVAAEISAGPQRVKCMYKKVRVGEGRVGFGLNFFWGVGKKTKKTMVCTSL